MDQVVFAAVALVGAVTVPVVVVFVVPTIVLSALARLAGDAAG